MDDLGSEYGIMASITNVNGDNVIQSLGAITINGNFPDNVDSVVIGGLAISVASQTLTTITCPPFDVHQTSLPFGDHLLVVDDASTTIALNPSAGYQYKTVVGLIADGSLKDIPGAADGHQVEIPTHFNTIELTLYEDSDVLLSPRMLNDDSFVRWWHNGSIWQGGPITIFQGVFEDVSWVGTPSPPAAVIGVQYSYSLSSLIQGDRPIDLTITAGELPEGLSVNSAIEVIEGAATEVGTFTDIEITASNSVAALTKRVS